ncbi:uncharacterized protein LOC129719831 [Wyeomyia smithii]|uniref:uncharacterized protein LOC129719831 n=1 Tax=Wyeomyia smithii TaxID=174621 RepID=UPI002468190E|nr:uncharacterized protein LOC129719831 [Wyeomyia smithii]
MAAAEKKAAILSLRRTLNAIHQRASKLLILASSFKDEDTLILKTREQVLKEMLMTFFEPGSRLYGMVKDDEVSSLEMEGEEFYDLLSEIKYQITKRLKPLPVAPEARPSLDASFAQKPYPDSCIKLPDFSLPRFSGHYEQWLYFRSQFNLLVRRNDSLNDQQRLHYLRSCLSGEAATIETPEEMFASLWMALEARYENRRWLVDRHLAESFLLKPLQFESSTGLRELVNIVQKNLRALSSLKLPLDTLSESMIVHVVASRLDKQTHKDFESHVVGTNLVKWQEMVDFLQNRCRILENLEQDHKVASRSNSNSIKPSGGKWKPNVLVSSNRDYDNKGKFSCFDCSGGHYINECRNFLSKSPTQRFQRVKELKLWVNCFSNRHVVVACKSSLCKECGLRHNTLLHFDSKPADASTEVKSNSEANKVARADSARVELCTLIQPVVLGEKTNPVSMDSPGPEAFRFPSEGLFNAESKKVQLISANDQALLHTALVLVRSASGELQECRAVLDSCAMSTFMTTACAKRLRLKTLSSDVSVVGFGGAGKKLTESVVAHVSSKSSYFEASAEFLVTPRITNKLPLHSFSIANWNIPDWIDLADPQLNKTAKIDILFGIVEWDKMMLSKSYILSKELPTFRQTVFGWVAGGHVKERDRYPKVQALAVTNEELDSQISKFWCIENYGSESQWSVEEQAAEDHFVSTHSRDPSGRYIVALPFKDEERALGDSSHMAHRRFRLLEARLAKDAKLNADYKQFMQEFIDLEHMEKVGVFNPVEPQSQLQYFMPHHAIKRPDSSTTKLRVVFDASARTSNATSLNDQLMLGPTLQPRLIELIKPRLHRMFRKCFDKFLYERKIVGSSKFCGGPVPRRKSVFIS